MFFSRSVKKKYIEWYIVTDPVEKLHKAILVDFCSGTSWKQITDVLPHHKAGQKLAFFHIQLPQNTKKSIHLITASPVVQ